MFIKHPLTQIPIEIKKQATYRIIMCVISSIVFKGVSFLLQFGKDQIAMGNIILGLVLIAIHFTSGTLRSLFNLWEDRIRQNFREAFQIMVNNQAANMLFKVRGKVWYKNEKTNSTEIMPTNVLIRSCKSYLDELWTFKTDLPMDIIDFVILLVSFVGFAFVSNLEIEHTGLFLFIISILSVCSVMFSRKRIQLFRKYRKTRKNAIEKQDLLMNDILNIEPLNKQHSQFMVDNYVNSGKSIFNINKSERKSVNNSDFLESLFTAFATVFIICLKIYETGLENVNIDVVLSIVSIMAIYNSIMGSIVQIVRNIEGTISTFDNINLYTEDFEKIVKVYDEEETTSNEHTTFVSKVTVPKFEVQYPTINSEVPFMLRSNNELTFKSDDIILLVGPTGSGKSTLMRLVTNYMKFDSFELNFETNIKGHIGTVMHQTDGKLGCNDILSELTLGQDVDEEKLLHILKGLHLFEEISAKDTDVISYLRNSKLENYSTGQKQRLAIARLLYNLTDDIQIIGFDEATNALNDAITLQTLGFIKEYCKGKILLIATHQVDSGNTIATKTLEFVPSGTHYEIKPI